MRDMIEGCIAASGEHNDEEFITASIRKEKKEEEIDLYRSFVTSNYGEKREKKKENNYLVKLNLERAAAA